MNAEKIKLYQIDNGKEARLWRTAIFVFDSSSLLDFYFLPKKTRENVYAETFTHLTNRLWMPGHVCYEFLKNRESVITKPIGEQYKLLRDAIVRINPAFINEVKKQVEDISRRTIKDDKHPHIDQNNINEIQSLISAFDAELKKFEKKILVQIENAEKEIKDVKSDDDVLKAIDQYFVVGDEYSFEKMMEISQEGKHRYEFKIPPGYGDLYRGEKKGLQIFGDLFIWKQILDFSKEKKQPIIFITNDLTKDEDWCYKEKGQSEDRILAPREELIREIFDHSNVEFWMYNLPQFLHNAKNYFKSNIPEETIQTLSQILNTKNSNGDYLKFKCDNCSKIHSYHRSEFNLEFNCVGSTERNMGNENHYEAMESFECDCGNEIIATFELWEYPIGSHNNDSIEIEGGELIEGFYFTIDFFENDYLDEFLRCEDCGGNKDGHGNYVQNWTKSELQNEYPRGHVNGKYLVVTSGSCDWCNTLHIRCPKCNSVNSFPEVGTNEKKECEGGCGLIFKYESASPFDDFSEPTLKLLDSRFIPCEACGEDFIDSAGNNICANCEEKYNNE